MFYFFGIFFKLNFCQPPTPPKGIFPFFVFPLFMYHCVQENGIPILYTRISVQLLLLCPPSRSCSSSPHGVIFFFWIFRFFGVFTFVKKFKCLDSFGYFWIYTSFVDFDIFQNITKIKFLYFILLYCFGLVWICSKVTSERYFGYYWTPKMA